MAIKCRGELLGGLYTGINSKHITMTSKMVQIIVPCLVCFGFGLFCIFLTAEIADTKCSNYSRYKSTVDFMYNHIKLLLVPTPLLMKVEFIR